MAVVGAEAVVEDSPPAGIGQSWDEGVAQLVEAGRLLDLPAGLDGARLGATADAGSGVTAAETGEPVGREELLEVQRGRRRARGARGLYPVIYNSLLRLAHLAQSIQRARRFLRIRRRREPRRRAATALTAAHTAGTHSARA